MKFEMYYHGLQIPIADILNERENNNIANIFCERVTKVPRLIFVHSYFLNYAMAAPH